ncbi:polysaccharide deacetylase family protein [Paenibacillus solisilvae]|uniref:Polysaccharide deacetylase family protein n=1 Tax=Paenibacillus solisilvae TaxID=2486751 RepID=A0ABW0W325_9BACL
MIQRSIRHKRRRFPVVFLIVGFSLIAVLVVLSTQSKWELGSDPGRPGHAQAVGSGGVNPSPQITDANLAGGEAGGSGAVQTADGKNDSTGPKPQLPSQTNVPPKSWIPSVSLDRPTAAIVQYQAKPGTKLVAITFDDGPDNRYTPAILDILKAYKVKATFFTVGTQIKKYPAVMKRIAAEGHSIGNHTYNHSDLTKKDMNGIKNQIKWTDTLIQRSNGFVPRLVRAPYGAVSPMLKAIIKYNNRELVGWTVDTDDWAGKSVAAMRANVNKNTHPGGIILMHSFGSKHIASTVNLLPLVIQDLRKKGYTFVTVDELLAAKNHGGKLTAKTATATA